MKLIAIALSMCISFNVLADSVQKLEKVFDDYQYSMTVEWDQKDVAFKEAQNSLLKSQIERMLERKEISVKEIETLVNEKTHDSRLVQDLNQKLRGEKVTPELVMSLLEERGLYQQGASWSPDEVADFFYKGLLVLFVVEIVVALATHTNTTCTETYDDGFDEYWSCVPN